MNNSRFILDGTLVIKNINTQKIEIETNLQTNINDNYFTEISNQNKNNKLTLEKQKIDKDEFIFNFNNCWQLRSWV